MKRLKDVLVVDCYYFIYFANGEIIKIEKLFDFSV